MILWASNVRPPTLKMMSHNFIMSLLKSFSNWVRIRMSLYTGMVCAADDGRSAYRLAGQHSFLQKSFDFTA
jgi:hypothetical protein